MKPARRSFLATLAALPLAARQALRGRLKPTRANLMRGLDERQWQRHYDAHGGAPSAAAVVVRPCVVKLPFSGSCWATDTVVICLDGMARPARDAIGVPAGRFVSDAGDGTAWVRIG